MSAEPTIPAGALAALATHALAAGTLDDVLRRVCEIALEVVEVADEASVSMLGESRPRTYGATGKLAVDADDAQYAAGGGPCLHAAEANQVVVVDDLLGDGRWAAGGTMARAGARSSLSLPLPLQGETIGALNLYARAPRVYDAEIAAIGREFSSYAAVAVANAISYSTAADAARNLRAAMESRAVIEQAKGILIGATGCEPEEAFRLLVQQSQHENRELREIAAEIVQRAVRADQRS